jgi:hypothetical protein
VVGHFLSPEFVKARDAYIKELDFILSKDFSEKVVGSQLNKTKNSQANTVIFPSTYRNQRFIRILLSRDEFLKKLRSFGIINKVITRPTSISFLTSLKDQDIIN